MALHNKAAQAFSAFNKNNLPAIALKGLALIKGYYKDEGLRPMADIDILVKWEDFDKAERTIKSIGYEFNSFRGSKQVCLSHHDHDFPYWDKKSGTVLELHWDVHDKRKAFPIDVDQFWANSQPIKIQNVPTRSFSPEDLLIHCCLHVSTHHALTYKLIHLIDIAKIASDDKLDWPLFWDRVESFKVRKPVYFTFLLLEKLLKIELPKGIMEKLGRGKTQKVIAHFVAGRFFYFNRFFMPYKLLRVLGILQAKFLF